MPKCELKPWEIGVPQVVCVDNEGKTRKIRVSSHKKGEEEC